MLIAISGSQGSGKSTILQELRTLGYNTVSRKTSRSILKDWNVTLDEVNSDENLTVRFQNEILHRKTQDEEQYVNSSDIWFTERTYADLFVYALISLGSRNNHNQFLSDYYRNCSHRIQQYSHVFYLKAGMFNVVSDGVRGSNQHYSRMVDLTMRDVTEQMILPSRYTLIATPSIEQRISIILSQSNTIRCCI